MTDKALIASVEQIESCIFLIRGQKVMLDADLAELYEVETRCLNEQACLSGCLPKQRLP